jgi:hypothetical protein
MGGTRKHSPSAQCHLERPKRSAGSRKICGCFSLSPPNPRSISPLPQSHSIAISRTTAPQSPHLLTLGDFRGVIGSIVNGLRVEVCGIPGPRMQGPLGHLVSVNELTSRDPSHLPHTGDFGTRPISVRVARADVGVARCSGVLRSEPTNGGGAPSASELAKIPAYTCLAEGCPGHTPRTSM